MLFLFLLLHFYFYQQNFQLEIIQINLRKSFLKAMKKNDKNGWELWVPVTLAAFHVK